MGLTYLDSSIIIHATDESEDANRVRSFLASEVERDFFVSPLVRMESLVQPIRRGDSARIAKREDLLTTFFNCKLDAGSFDLATHVRARHGLSTADAIHVAAASLNGCDAIWTTDRQLARKLPNFAVDILGVS